MLPSLEPTSTLPLATDQHTLSVFLSLAGCSWSLRLHPSLPLNIYQSTPDLGLSLHLYFTPTTSKYLLFFYTNDPQMKISLQYPPSF